MRRPPSNSRVGQLGADRVAQRGEAVGVPGRPAGARRSARRRRRSTQSSSSVGDAAVRVAAQRQLRPALASRRLDRSSAGGGTVSSSSRRVPRHIASALLGRRCRSTRTADAVALVDQRRVAGDRVARRGGCSTVRGSAPMSQSRRPVRSSPSPAAATVAPAPSARSRACSASRSLPSAERRAVLVDHPEGHPQVVGHPVEVPRVARHHHAGAAGAARCSSASSSGPSPGRHPASDGRGAVRAPGTKLRRSALGSDRISAVTSSCAQARAPASRSRPASTWLSSGSGTCDGHAVGVARPARTGSVSGSRSSPWPPGVRVVASRRRRPRPALTSIAGSKVSRSGLGRGGPSSTRRRSAGRRRRRPGSAAS